jgi:hypothetical protein
MELPAKRFQFGLAIAALLGVAFVGAAIYLPRYPATQAKPLASEIAATAFKDPKDALVLKKDLLQYETDNQIKIWTALAQVLGALVIAGGVYFTWSNLQVAQRNLRATELKLDVDRQGQITNRFTQAVGQLGADSKEGRPNLEVRLGGIYALERIAKDSPGDYWMVMEILTAYVRENARWPQPSSSRPSLAQTAVYAPATARAQTTGTSDQSISSPKPRVDIQAIMTILGRNLPPALTLPDFKLDLREVDLRGAELWNSSLWNIDFWGAHLESARFWGALLRGIKLESAHLMRTSFWNARLEDVDLRRADLKEAVFDGSDLRGAINLTQEQIVDALGNADTKLPVDVPRPAGWREPPAQTNRSLM